MKMSEKVSLTMSRDYYGAFWQLMRRGVYLDVLENGKIEDGTQLLPAQSATAFTAALKNNDLFRQYGTVLTKIDHDAKVLVSNNDSLPQWVSASGSISVEADDSFPSKSVTAYKLAIITSLEDDFISDIGFDLESYLIGRFSKAFGKAEENAFINGTGVSMPKGILHSTDGAETGITVTGDITFDDVLALYFSVDKKYRGNGMWLMNDETALILKTLKNQDGLYLWNQNSDTILGKPVYISEYMPSDGKIIAFGDFSFYYIIDRVPLGVRALNELYAMNQKTGFLGTERLDGLLIRPEAIKVLEVEEASGTQDNPENSDTPESPETPETPGGGE